MSALLMTSSDIAPFSFRAPALSRLVTFTLASVLPSISAEVEVAGDKGVTGIFVGVGAVLLPRSAGRSGAVTSTVIV